MSNLLRGGHKREEPGEENACAPERMDSTKSRSTTIHDLKNSFKGMKLDWQDAEPQLPSSETVVGSREEAALLSKLRANVPVPSTFPPDLAETLAMCCLRFRRYDLSSAEERLRNYLQWRTATFGGLESHCLAGDAKLQSRLETRYIMLLPQPLPTGERILLLQLRYLRPEVFTALESVKGWHYWVMRSLYESPDFQARGVVIMISSEGADLSCLDPRVPKAILKAISKCVPLRLCRIFHLKPLPVIRLLLPIFKIILSSKMRERLTVLNDYAQLQSEWHIPRECLPSEIGGTLEFDVSHWARQRLTDPV